MVTLICCHLTNECFSFKKKFHVAHHTNFFYIGRNILLVNLESVREALSNARLPTIGDKLYAIIAFPLYHGRLNHSIADTSHQKLHTRGEKKIAWHFSILSCDVRHIIIATLINVGDTGFLSVYAHWISVSHPHYLSMSHPS